MRPGAVRLALAVLWTGGAAAALVLPGRFVPAVPAEWTLAAHVVFFAGAAALWGWAFGRHLTLVAAAAVALAVGSEVWQGTTVPGRGAQWLDLAADLVGVALGLGGAWLLRRRARRV